MNTKTHVAEHTAAGCDLPVRESASAGSLVRGWQPAPGDLQLDKESVHIWRAQLDVEEPVYTRITAVLNRSERERERRYYFARDGQRFAVARGVLRQLLGRYVQMEPAGLVFECNAQGKPFLAIGAKAARIHFNVSHAQGLALYAVACEREVGIDVERIRPELLKESLAERFFAPGEVAAIRKLGAAEQVQAFFNCWTRKEAFVKANGLGLSLALDQFEVSVLPGIAAQVLSTRFDPGEAGRWGMWALEPGEGYVGALVAAGQDCFIQSYECPKQ